MSSQSILENASNVVLHSGPLDVREDAVPKAAYDRDGPVAKCMTSTREAILAAAIIGYAGFMAQLDTGRLL